MSNQNDPRREIYTLLQQLSIGLSAYRLFPGDLEQQSFVGAVERVRAAAERALTGGTVVVEIHGPQFRSEHGELQADETLGRLAMACYERRGERLRVRAIPDAHDLGVFYGALTRMPEEVEAVGGLGKLLREDGVSSIAVGEVEPQAMDSVLMESLTEEQAELWEQLQHGGPVNELLGQQDGMAQEEAELLYERFRDLVEALPEELSANPDLYRRLQESVNALPEDVLNALLARLLEGAKDEPVANRLMGSMTDAEMARALVDVAKQSKRDPVALAREVVVRDRGRSNSLVEMTMAMVGGQVEGGMIATGSRGETATRTEDAEDGAGDVVSRAVSDMLARELETTEEGDLKEIREDFPREDAHYREAAEATLRDYLGVEEDLERLEVVLELWSEEVRAHLSRSDAVGAAKLMELVRSALPTDDDGHRASLIEVYGRRILDATLIESLLAGGGDVSTIRRLLEPIGPAAVDGLFDALADEKDRSRRALLIGSISELAGDHRELIARRLEDPRWYVARNAITILQRAGLSAKDVPLLEQASRHDHPAVRRESVEALASALGSESVSQLSRMTQDPDASVADLAVSTLGALVSPRAVLALADVARGGREWNQRRRAIEAITRHSGAGATEALRLLASFRSRPRLPRSLRRIARKALKERKVES